MKGNPNPHKIVIAQHSRDERLRSQERSAAKVEALIQERQALARKAVDAVVFGPKRWETEKALALNQGVWWDELGPLTPQERTIVLDELRKLFRLLPRQG